jgi:hypothetical protein
MKFVEREQESTTKGKYVPSVPIHVCFLIPILQYGWIQSVSFPLASLECLYNRKKTGFLRLERTIVSQVIFVEQDPAIGLEIARESFDDSRSPS